MDNPQDRTDELVSKINDFNYRVDSLLVLAWAELSELNSEKSFLDTHKDVVKSQKFTKLEEVGYILQLAGELSKDQSVELTDRIQELEKTKTLLEAHNRKLREQLNYTDNLLAEVVEENKELVEKLGQKGLSGKELEKQLKQKQLIETQDNTIQRLQVALGNARRELDIINRSRSPTPSLGAELLEKEFDKSRIPSVIIQQEQNGAIGRVEIPVEEQIAIDILGKTKSIISNAKKTGSRGYTRETESKKLGELEHYREKFDEWENKGIIDNKFIREFNSLVPIAEEILARRSPSPRESQITDRTRKKGDNSTNTSNMMTFAELLKNVSHMVPIFYGTDGPEITTETSKFIEGCMIAKDNLAETGSVVDILKCIKTRLFGNAYAYLHNKEFATVEALCQAVREKFIKTKTLSEIQELIFNSRQGTTESAYEFGERLEGLLRNATELIVSQWQDPSHQKSMMDHCNQSAVRSYIRGLRDPKLVSRFIGHENDNLSYLLKITKDAQNLLGTSTRSPNVMTVHAHESLYETVQQLVNEVRQLSLQKQTFNHSMPTSNIQKNSFSSTKFCSFCSRRGHSLNECFSRQNSTYYNQNRRQEHANYNAGRNLQPFDPRKNTQISAQPLNRNRNNVRFDNVAKREQRCYSCNRLGHFASSCPENNRHEYNNNRNRGNGNNSNRGNRIENRCGVVDGINNSGNEGRPGQN